MGRPMLVEAAGNMCEAFVAGTRNLCEAFLSLSHKLRCCTFIGYQSANNYSLDRSIWCICAFDASRIICYQLVTDDDYDKAHRNTNRRIHNPKFRPREVKLTSVHRPRSPNDVRSRSSLTFLLSFLLSTLSKRYSTYSTAGS